MNLSYWEREAFFKNIDIAIIGSGIVGLCAAIELKSEFPRKKVVIFERSFLPAGASTKNAGFACFGSISELLKDRERFSEDAVFQLFEKRWRGIKKLNKLLGYSKIGYEKIGNYEVFTDEYEFQKCADYLEIIHKFTVKVMGAKPFKIKDKEIDRFGFHGFNHLIFNEIEGVVNTGLLMKNLLAKAMAVGVEIFNGIEISNITNKPNGAKLALDEHNWVDVKKVLVTTNAFAKQLLPSIKLHPGRGQVLITKPIKNLKVLGAFHYNQGYYYFRNIEDRLLIGGGRNLDFNAEQTTIFGTTELVQNELKRMLDEMILPNTKYEIDYTWSGIMAFGNANEPIIKQLGPHVFCAVKCQGMGVALGAVVGEEAANLVGSTY